VTKTKKTITKITTAAFWDTSAIVPLCCQQVQTQQARHYSRHYVPMIVWWGTTIEAWSTFNRLLRQKHLSSGEYRQAIQTFDKLKTMWGEISPLDEVRQLSERLLRTHNLTAGDAMQLASALVWCDERPKGRHFICADEKLTIASEAEGFMVIHLQ
jgi:uncharacterized protein